MIQSTISKRKKSQRYITEDDEDDGGDETAVVGSSTPGMCLVFLVPDEDEVEPELLTRIKESQSDIIGRLRALNLVVETQQTDRALFLRIFAPLPMQKYEAEEQVIRIRLKSEYGGALCAYSDELELKNAFEKSLDDFDLFSSAKQLVIINCVATSVPYTDKNGEIIDPLEFDRLKEDPDKGVLAYFPLHHDRFQMILKREWAFSFFNPQCLEKVREYFGDEIALFFTWIGFYITMLWLPAIWGTAMFLHQLQHGEEGPYMLSLSIANVIWGVLFVRLWASLQLCRSYQWDTLHFEEEEKLVDLWAPFKEHELTQKNEHINEVTAEIDEYWYDEGTYFPPTGRRRTQLINRTFIFVVDIVFMVIIRSFWTSIARPMMSEGNTVGGAVTMGVLDFALKKGLDIALFGVAELGFEKGLLEYMVCAENWSTRTDYNDAEIWTTFFLKIVTQYFAFIWVGFLANYSALFPDENCPGWHCLPILSVMVLTEVVLISLYSVFELVGIPSILRWWADRNDVVANSKRAAGIKIPPKSSMEQQFEKQEPPRVVDLYRTIIYDHLGVFLLFGTASPVSSLCIMVFGMIYLRITAHIFLNLRQRELPNGAEDIGAYEIVIEALQMVSLVTNALIIGSTSFTLYFYNPSLSTTDVLWATIIFEHVLMLIKICLVNILPREPADAKLENEVQRERKVKQLKKWNLPEKTRT